MMDRFPQANSNARNRIAALLESKKEWVFEDGTSAPELGSLVR